MRKALRQTSLPRRDSAIVVTVTAAIVGLIVLWMSQAGAGARTSPLASESLAEDPAVPPTFVIAGE